MKRLAALTLCACLLAGCAESEAPAQSVPTVSPAPTAAPQALSVYAAAGENTAAARAVQCYAEAQGVALTFVDDVQQAGLVILPAAPAQDGSWMDFSSDALLTAAAELADMDGGTVTALPIGRSLYGYWADSAMLEELLGADAVSDLQAASWSEWETFAQTLTGWIATPSPASVTLGGHTYTLPEEKSGRTAALTAVFDTPDPSYEADNTAALYTGVLLAAGEQRSEQTLIGPLNGLFSAIELEQTHQANEGEQALFRRGFLADLALEMEPDEAERLVPLPVKCDFVEDDLSTVEYNLTGLMNYPIFAAPAWLAIPADAGEEQTRAAASAILWLYTSTAGEQALTGDLLLVSPWGTASDGSVPGAMQIEQVGTGILPGVMLDCSAAQALADADEALCYEQDGSARTDWSKAAREEWREKVIAALDNTNVQP